MTECCVSHWYEAHKRSKGSYDFDTQRRILARLDSEGHAAFSFVLTLLTFVGALAVYTSEYPIIPCNFRVVKYVDQTIDQTYKNGIMLYDNQTESSCVVIFDHYILPDVVATKYAIRSIQSGFQKGNSAWSRVKCFLIEFTPMPDPESSAILFYLLCTMSLFCMLFTIVKFIDLYGVRIHMIWHLQRKEKQLASV